MGFHNGQEIECIDDSNIYGAARKHGVFKGRTYTVVGYKIAGHIKLAGIPDAWNEKRFRPLTKPKTSVSFTEGAPVDSERWDNRFRLPVKV